jgi:glutamate-1-semialdehyde 2,1-aminomutase
MSAGLATLGLLQQKGFYDLLEEKSLYLEQGLIAAAAKAPFKTCFQRVGAMFCTFFTEGPVYSFADALKSDTSAFGRFFRSMLNAGVNLAPSQFEAGFMSAAHSKEDLDQTIKAAEAAFSSL